MVESEQPVPSIYSSASSWVSEVSPAARNTLDFARIPRASKLLICGLFQKGRVLAQDGERVPQHELLACAQCGCFAFSCFEDFAIKVNGGSTDRRLIKFGARG